MKYAFDRFCFSSLSSPQGLVNLTWRAAAWAGPVRTEAVALLQNSALWVSPAAACGPRRQSPRESLSVRAKGLAAGPVWRSARPFFAFKNREEVTGGGY